jgi:hypothetical protein
MIKLEAAHIEELRGIRKLDLDFSGGTFSISGPNGSGKSGVIDAIEFGLTGEIGRLTGRGTKGLSIAEHGPHVDKTKFPDAAFVELRVSLPSIGDGLPAPLIVLAPFDVVNAFAVYLSAPVDLHSIFEPAIGLQYCWTQLPLPVDFDFLQNVDLVSDSVLSQMKHGGDCPSSKISRKKLRGWTPEPKFQDTKGHQTREFQGTTVDTKRLSY